MTSEELGTTGRGTLKEVVVFSDTGRCRSGPEGWGCPCVVGRPLTPSGYRLDRTLRIWSLEYDLGLNKGIECHEESEVLKKFLGEGLEGTVDPWFVSNQDISLY